MPGRGSPPLRRARGGAVALRRLPEARDSRGRFGLTSGRRRWGPGLGGALSSGEPPGAQPLLPSSEAAERKFRTPLFFNSAFSLRTDSPLYSRTLGAL